MVPVLSKTDPLRHRAARAENDADATLRGEPGSVVACTARVAAPSWSAFSGTPSVIAAGRRSYPVGPDALTGGQVLSVVGDQVVSEVQEAAQPGVGDDVEDTAALSFGAHELAPAQACEVVGYPAARQAGPRDEFADTARFGEELLEDGQAGRIGQHPEPARAYHCPGRRPGRLGLIAVLGHDDDRMRWSVDGRCPSRAGDHAGPERASARCSRSSARTVGHAAFQGNAGAVNETVWSRHLGLANRRHVQYVSSKTI